MKFIADLHIHSFYSRATSSELNFEQLYKWAQLKGIHVVATGDVTHPGWLSEIEQKLDSAEEGLFRLKEEFSKAIDAQIPSACRNEVRFILSGEISNIYKKGDRVRKNHHVVFLPSIQVAKKFQSTLEKIGNIRSDGRPILGLDARDLLELVLQSDELSFLIPAHIWTPWFSVLGSKSGFDSIDACFEDLTSHIFALETGLSSDPPMNWMLSQLDRFTLVSNSDAHSPAKLGREANIFNCEVSYPDMVQALKSSDPEKFLGTIEFFPEEGKYHLDGHRKCNVRMTPAETIASRGICPVCSKPVTVGVLNRVEELADRPEGSRHDHPKPFHSLIPLPEVIGEILDVGSGTKTVDRMLDKLLRHLGSELAILMDVPLGEIEKAGGSLFAEGIRRMRNKEVKIAAGYDGEFGAITLFTEQERQEFASSSLFFQKDDLPLTKINRQPISKVKDEQADFGSKQSDESHSAIVVTDAIPDLAEDEEGLNPQQREAVEAIKSDLLIVAGPGTGKTRALTYRIANIIKNKNIPPEHILAVTFTNRAAREMQDRLRDLLGEEPAKSIVIKTFHAFGAMILQQEAKQLGYQPNFSIYSEEEKIQLLKKIAPAVSQKELRDFAERIAEHKNQISFEQSAVPIEQDTLFLNLYHEYQKNLKSHNAFDFDDLIIRPIELFHNFPKILKHYQNKFSHIAVDEYQDINAAQYRLLRSIVTPKTNVCVIGDPDQAIYGFRGSDRRFFLQFEQDFPDCRIIKLEKNYRSVSTILQASTQVIARNSDHLPLTIWSKLVANTRIDTFLVPSEKSEAETIVHQIERLVGATSFFSVDSGRAGEDEPAIAAGFGDIAVFYRVNAQFSALEEAFIRSGIPFQALGDLPFFAIPEVKEIISYLKVIHNPHSDPDLHRVLHHLPRGIGDQTLRTLSNYQKMNELSLWQAMVRIHQIAVLSETQKQPIDQLVQKIKHCQDIQRDASLQAIIELILSQVGLSSYFKTDKRRQHYWQKLIEQISDFSGSIEEFLEQIALQKETDIFDPKAEKVSLMTLHAAKGLEFPIVFIAGCEEGLLPYHYSDRSPGEIEEERRLFYVGMTRAKQRLILLHAKSRFLFGERKSNAPSRFLNDIDAALKEQRSAPIKDKQKKQEMLDNSQLQLF